MKKEAILYINNKISEYKVIKVVDNEEDLEKELLALPQAIPIIEDSLLTTKLAIRFLGYRQIIITVKEKVCKIIQLHP